VNESKLRERVVKALAKENLAWTDLVSQCEQIVLFGSVAAGLEVDRSDVDLLCVGIGARKKSKSLDLIWYSPAFVITPQWRASELGSHIMKYGIWLHGKKPDFPCLPPSPSAIAFKRRLISSRARALARTWDDLSRHYREKHITKIRRDLQRLSIMESGDPVPVTPILDRKWSALPPAERKLAKALEGTMVKDLLPSNVVMMFDSHFSVEQDPRQ
jgi:hypothetical protein